MKSEDKNEVLEVQLYNSLSKKKERLKTIEDCVVKMYSCGPTVYNNLHIGNLATFIRDDLLKRVLLASGYKVNHVMNITDVEDKIIRDSNLPEFTVPGDPMQSLLNLTSKFDAVFRDDIEKIGNDVSSVKFIKATESIEGMLSLIQNLLDNGLAYKAEDGIYFSIQKYIETGNEYGILQKVDLDSGRERISNDEYEKDSAADFVLWKAKVEGEPFWDAELKDSDGVKFNIPGRPGWHIECSAMSNQLLGMPLDIHTGGIDLKFPHHENEIAQSCGALKLKTLANVFYHMSHILVDGRKMSKSLNNFYTLRDVEQRGFEPAAFRMLVLSGHPRSEINFTWEILEAAQNRLKNWQATADLRWQVVASKETQIKEVEMAKEAILAKLVDDLNTPLALSVIEESLGMFESGFPEFGKDDMDKLLTYIKDLIGIDLFGDDISEKQKELLDLRQKSRNEKNFEESDRIRDELKTQGIEVRDDARGQIWSRV
jgi:cysteinyl-tRNA synthetase